MNNPQVELSKQNRYGEQGNTPPRNKRIYALNNEWYFLTREYGVFGPYSDFLTAKQELKIYMRRLGIVRMAVS